MTCRGCTPLDVATATIRDNAELCLALDDAHLHHVVSLLVSTTTSVAVGGGSLEQGGGEDGREGSVGSVACDWAPNGGEKCLDFLQCAVWADGTYVRSSQCVYTISLHPQKCLTLTKSWNRTQHIRICRREPFNFLHVFLRVFRITYKMQCGSQHIYL